MKKILLIALAMLFCFGAIAQAAEFDLSIAHIVAEDNSWHKASVFFKEEVEKRSNGRIGVTIYPNSQLGTEVEQIQSALANEETQQTQAMPQGQFVQPGNPFGGFGSIQ